MKVKNLSLVEKWIEKAILIVAIIYSLGVLWLFVLGDPHKVDIGGSERVLPEVVEDKINAAAGSLKTKLEKKELPDELKAVAVPQYIPDFVSRMERGATSGAVVRHRYILGNQGLDPHDFDLGGDSSKQGTAFVTPSPPAPRLIDSGVEQGYGVLAEPSLEDVIAYEKMIGSQRPRDIRWVTVAATFDMARWQKMNLLTEEEAEYQGGKAPPAEWIRGSMGVVYTVLEREEKDPNDPNSTWRNAVTIGTLPHQVTEYRLSRVNWTPEKGIEVIRQVLNNQPRTQREPFPPLAEGFWTPPGMDLTDQDDRMQLEDLKAQIQQLQRDAQNVRMSLSGVAGEGREQQAKLAELNGRLEAAQARLLRLAGYATAKPTTQPAESAGALGAAAGAGAASAVDRRTDTTPAEPATQNLEPVTVWSHDITAQPGKMYRYRIKVAVLNPLFQRPELPESQVEQQFQFVRESAPSQWSDPIVIEPRFTYYATSVNPSTHAATIEIYGIFNGQRIMVPFSLEAGDVVGGVRRLPVGEREYMLDMTLPATVVYVDTSGGRSSGVVIYDEATNRLIKRIPGVDRTDRTRLRQFAETQAGD